jgi:HEAT repeats
MTNSPEQDSASLPQHHELSNDLPPVQPPSASFIVQLFVVPGLIVLAVVAIWALFGRIAAGEQDWRKLALELQSHNTHIRNRAMYGLSQILDQDRLRGKQGQHLASNPEIVSGLSNQLLKELQTGSSSPESVAIQQYLTRALGLLNIPDSADNSAGGSQTLIEGNPAEATSPCQQAAMSMMNALKAALESNRDIEIRKSAVASVAFIAGRSLEQGSPLDAPELVDALIAASSSSEPVLRHAVAWTLGQFRSEQATQHLQVLLGHDDVLTRINAAISLSHSGSLDGLAVFKQALSEPTASSPEGQGEQVIIVTNVLRALTDLGPKLSETDKAEFRELVEKLLKTNTNPRVHIDARNAFLSLK